jgi:Raf kinase inhibitor-like YbhB/YbcL family protein
MENRKTLTTSLLGVMLGFFIFKTTVCLAEGGGMRLTSPAFSEGKGIPVKYSCDGENISPPLNWESLPDGTKGLALICSDPDAPSKTWVHWVFFDIPPEKNGLPENVPHGKQPELGGIQCVNDSSVTGYFGPCPPDGEHRYYFKLYALDAILNLKPGFFGISTSKLLKAMKGHILGEATLMGTFSR